MALREKAAAEQLAWNTTFDSAMDQRNRAESDLVYGNESRARAEIDQAKTLMTNLPKNNADRQTKMDKLEKDVSDLQERLKKVTKIDDVTELTSLTAAASPGSLSAPLLLKDTAYVIDQSSNTLLKISITTKEVKRIPLPEGTWKVVSSSAGKNAIIFTTDDGKILSLDIATDLVKQLTWTHAKMTTPADSILYNGRIYALDPSQSQIWRFTQSGDTFAGEAGYIKAANAPINDGVAIAIDSNVYVLKSNGTIVEFLSGGQVSFNLFPIDPPLRAASNIWTDVDSTSLYITDPSDKRVLIFDKSGTLKTQITSSQFNELRDVSVDEASKKMTVVDGNRLLLVPLP